MSVEASQHQRVEPARASDAPEPEMRPVAVDEQATEAESRVNRFWLAVFLATFGAFAATGVIAGAQGGAMGLLVAIALHTVPGLVIGLVTRLRGMDLILAWFVGSLGVLILCSFPFAINNLWHPRAIGASILVLSVAGAVWAARTHPSGTHATWLRQAFRASAGPVGLATAGFLLAVITAAVRAQPPSYYGAAWAAGPFWFIGLGAIVFAVCWAFSSTRGLGWSIVLLATVVPMSQAMMYGMPTVQVAARHIGIVQQLITNNGLDRNEGIYQAYSGLFTSSALVQQAAGWSDMMLYAAVFGAVGAGVNCLAVAALARYFVDDERAWWAALVFALGSSLTTSFYAPQVVGLAFVTVATMALLRNSAGLRWSRIAAAAMLSVTVAFTHQISPFLATLVCIALVVVRLMKLWWAPAVLITPAVIWALLNRGVLKSYVSADELFNILKNFRTPTRQTSSALSPDLINMVTFRVPAFALFCIGVAAIVALVRFRNKMTLGLALAAASPVGLFAASSYGAEGAFRVTLFCLPWLAIIGSINLPKTGRRFWTVPWHPVRNAGVVALTLVFVIGTTGMDYTRVMREENVKAIRWIESHITDDSQVYTLGTELADPLPLSGKDVFYISRELLLLNEPGIEEVYPSKVGDEYDPQADLQLLMRYWMARPGDVRYVLATASMKAFDQRYGQQLVSDQTRLEEALRKWPGVTVVYQGDGAAVYQLPEGGSS